MTEKSRRILLLVALAIAGVLGLVFLFFFNPSQIEWFPRCPFLALTGYKCPGCGTLRGIHHLSHLRFREAWLMNPLMVVSIPVLAAMVFVPRIRRNVILGWTIFVVTLVYWLGRNIWDWTS